MTVGVVFTLIHSTDARACIASDAASSRSQLGYRSFPTTRGCHAASISSTWTASARRRQCRRTAPVTGPGGTVSRHCYDLARTIRGVTLSAVGSVGESPTR